MFTLVLNFIWKGHNTIFTLELQRSSICAVEMVNLVLSSCLLVRPGLSVWFVFLGLPKMSFHQHVVGMELFLVALES